MFWEIVFWGSLGVVAYVYLGYPVLVGLWSRLAGRNAPAPDVRETCELPFVSLIIAAYREEDVILERLRNALEVDYPADRFEVLVGCDGEEDLTGDLARTFDDSRVRVIQFPVRRGKAQVLNDCVPQARGEIVVFSDANTMMDRDAIRRLVEPFSDPQVGGVCGQLILTDPASGQNVDGIYWRYENFLKRCESQLGALLGANGAIYAIRKELYEPLPPETLVDDFVIGMRIHLRGYRLLYEERAIAREETPPGIDDEFHRRARIGAGGFQSLAWLWPLLNPLRGRVALAFWSHKVLRWFSPAFLVMAMVANVLLVRQPFYLRVLLLHELFYLAAALGLWVVHGGGWRRAFRIPAMFVSMNAALVVGFFRWAVRIRGGTWKRTARVTTAEGTRVTTGEGTQARREATSIDGDGATTDQSESVLSRS